MLKTIKITLLFFCLFSDFLQIGAQPSRNSGESVIDSLRKQPTFTIYGDNY